MVMVGVGMPHTRAPVAGAAALAAVARASCPCVSDMALAGGVVGALAGGGAGVNLRRSTWGLAGWVLPGPLAARPSKRSPGSAGALVAWVLPGVAAGSTGVSPGGGATAAGVSMAGAATAAALAVFFATGFLVETLGINYVWFVTRFRLPAGNARKMCSRIGRAASGKVQIEFTDRL